MSSDRPRRRAEPLRARAARAWPAALLCVGCAAQLAPRADPELAAALRAANRDTQILLQTLRAPRPAPCRARDATYADLVGRLRALQMQAVARAVPAASLLARAQPKLRRIDPGFSAQPSARALAGAAATLQQMHVVDCAGRLHGAALAALANQADVFLGQALAYEAMLER